ncbi:hypothetical protein D3C85_1866750 [compost metagenome]
MRTRTDLVAASRASESMLVVPAVDASVLPSRSSMREYGLSLCTTMRDEAMK